MPEAFEKCVRMGGKVRTVKGKQFGCAEGEYRHICIIGGMTSLGEIHRKKGKGQ